LTLGDVVVRAVQHYLIMPDLNFFKLSWYFYFLDMDGAHLTEKMGHTQYIATRSLSTR